MRRLITSILLLLSCSFVFSGEVTIEKKSSLINNALFKEKQNRADEYKDWERNRAQTNQHWIMNLPAGCRLFNNRSFLYKCNHDLFYKGYQVETRLKYRQLTPVEISEMNKLQIRP